jgi:Molecular chaperone
MPVERIIGIDFGTSTSVVKIKTYKDNEPLGPKSAVEYVHFDNKDSLPTLVYMTNENKYLIGYEAKNPAVKGTLYQNFKLNLISNDEALRNEALLYTEIFFKYMYEAYDAQKPHFPACDIETTYVSYPAKWPEELRRSMISIAVKAGFKNVIGLDEPTAAIRTVMVQESEKLVLGGQDWADILMIDMGAGTTDLVLCRYSPYDEEQVKIMITWPKADSNCLFGGCEVDEILCDYIKAFLIDCGLPNTKNFNENYMDKCKTWKETSLSPVLKDVNSVVKYCGFIDTLLAMLDIEKDFPSISRNNFEDMLAGYISQFPMLITDCLKDIDYDANKLDYVILTGGHSQWYFTGEILEGTLTRFGTLKLPKITADSKRIIKLARPQETVALGLVYQRMAIKQQDRPSIKVTGIINLIAERYMTKTGVDLLADNTALKRIEEAAKKAVAELDGADTAEINIPYISADSTGPLHVKETITRSELEVFITRYKNHKSNGKKICNRCGKNIPITATYCGYCGSKVMDTSSSVKKPAISQNNEKVCSKCGKKIPVTAMYCGYCGNKDTGTGGNVKAPEIVFKAEIFCPHCGKKIQGSSVFCGYCGTTVKNSL